MRREGEARSSEVAGQAEIHEHVHLDIDDHNIKRAWSIGSGRRLHGEPEPNLETCEDYHMNTQENSDTCEAGVSSFNQEKCIKAATALGLAVGDPFKLNISFENPLPYPKNCFADTSETPVTVYFNPSGSSTGGLTLIGKKICVRALYTNGTQNKDAAAACKGINDDYVPILEYDACLYAMTACAGGGAPKLEPFFLNTTKPYYAPANKPSGCFQEVSSGKWGFNWAHKTGVTVDESLMEDSQSICYDSTANSGGDVPAAAAAGLISRK